MQSGEEQKLPSAWAWLLDDSVDLGSLDLPEDIQTMIGLVGREDTVRLLQRFAGLQVFFPSLKAAHARYRNIQIQRSFTGSNHKELARRFHLSVQSIYNIVRDAG